MKILYIKPGRIFENSGGGIEAKKLYYSLDKISKENQNIDAIYISSDEISNEQFGIKASKRKIKDVLSRAFLHSTYLFCDWSYLGLRRKVLDLGIDIVILGNSRLGFIAKDLKKINKKILIIGHFDNIEYDYVEGVYAERKGLASNLAKRIEKFAIKRDEENFVKYIDLPLFLSNRDRVRVEEIYKLPLNKNCVLPICIEETNIELAEHNEYQMNLVFLGSLWYMSNVNAIKWFLENVWNELQEKYNNISFIIGGSNPSKTFIEYIKNFSNVKVYPNFAKKEDIIPKNSVFISPIQTGAGMKVKIAEALEMGLPVIGSDETLIGYDEAVSDELNRDIIILANSPYEYIDAIDIIYKKLNDKENIRDLANKLYKKYYSIDRAVNDIKLIIKENTEYNTDAWF